LEGGPPIFRQDCTCPALLEDPGPGFPYGAVTRSGSSFQTLPVPKTRATGLIRVRSPLLTESRLMSFPPATEMFQFGDPGITDRSHLPRAFRSVPRPSSPLSAKASTRCPSLALGLPSMPPAHRGKTPHGPQSAPAASHEDTSRIGCPPDRRPRAGPIRLGHMTNSRFTLQTTRVAATPQRDSALLRQTPVVEVNGFEPMTSCLQSRRSPN
jgi:hypothetical protein